PCRHRDPGHPPGVLSLRAQQLAELVGGSGALPLHLGGGARLLELGGGAAPLPLRHGGSAPAARGRRHLRGPLRGGDGRLPLGPDRERRRAGGGHGVADLAGDPGAHGIALCGLAGGRPAHRAPLSGFIGPRGLRPRAARWPRRMTLILSLGFVLFLLANVPIALALGGAAVLALLWEGQIPLLIVPQRIFTGVDSFPLLAIPLFIFAGELMEHSGISERLVRLAQVLVGWLRGGIGMTVVVAEIFLSGISGSTVADTSALGTTMIP